VYESTKDIFVEIGYSLAKKKIKINKEQIKRVDQLIGLLPIVVFRNEDIDLVLGSPQFRRRYMDITLSLASSQYLRTLQTYLKVLKQRNAQLKKEKEHNNSYSSVWNEQLINYGSQIIWERNRLFQEITQITKLFFEEMNKGKIHFDMLYKCSFKCDTNDVNIIKQSYQKALEKDSMREVRLGQTLYGPHKDDFLIRSDNVDFKKYASQGQNRACSLALHLTMCKYIEKIKNEKTILLLDDILLDLDKNRKVAFLNLVTENQCFFTATSIDGLSSLKSDKNVFKVSNGVVTSQ
jgi:DNA replication and repair protein RecF